MGVIRVENGKFLCQTRQKFVKGDCFKILRDGKEVGGATFCSDLKGWVQPFFEIAFEKRRQGVCNNGYGAEFPLAFDEKEYSRKG